MTVFLVEWAFTLAALLVLALTGAFVLIAFRQGRRFVLLLAPMCGLLVLPLVTTFIYTFGRISLSRAAIAAILIGSAISAAVSIRWRPSREDVCWSFFLIAVLSALAAALSMSSSIYNGSPSLLFIDGSDHAGYAHFVDWLLNHPVNEPPKLSPDAPYESWPHYMLGDPRLSSVIAHALVAWGRGSSGLFAYDAACAVLFAAAVLGVACVFSRSPRTLVLLSVGLATCAWFDLGRSGYLGKLAGYPATLFVLGILLTNVNRDVKFVAAAVVLTAGAGTLHSAFPTALFIGVIGCTYITATWVVEFIDKRQRAASTAHLVTFGATFLIALACNGMFGRLAIAPIGIQFPHSWSWILPRVLDLQNHAVDVIRAPSFWLSTLLTLAIVFHLAIVMAAVAARNAIAVALTGGPLALLGLLYVSGHAWIGYQIVGTLFPYSLCAVAYLSDEPAIVSKRAVLFAVMTGAVALIAIHVPRFWGAVDRYALNVTGQHRYAASDFEKIAAIVGPDGIVQINLHEPLPAIAALVEFGRRGMIVQWSPEAWKTILAYRKWPPPTYAVQAGFRLTDRSEFDPNGEVMLETPQYRLWRLRTGR